MQGGWTQETKREPCTVWLIYYDQEENLYPQKILSFTFINFLNSSLKLVE